MASGKTEFLVYAGTMFNGFIERLGSFKNLSNAFRYIESVIVSTIMTGLELYPISLSIIDSTRPLDRP